MVGGSCLLVALRALNRGPIEAPVTIYRPLNLESAAAVGLLLLLFLFGRKAEAALVNGQPRRWELPALGLVLAVTLACYWRSLWWPLTSDDYVIVMRALRGELLPETFTSGDAGVAFRPLNRFLFAAQGWLGSSDPAWWHSIGLLFHLANCALLFRLARILAGAGPALAAAALFGLHATHPEAVSWMNSRSDLLAAFFLMAALAGFTAVSLAPALPLALVGADLFGARVYYLPSAGFALMIATALKGVRARGLRTAAAALLPMFHFAALRHQLGVWESVTALARRTCVEAAGPILSTAGSEVVVQGIPDKVDGVFFLSNGFSEFLEYYSGRRLPSPIVVGGEPSSPSAAVFRWDPAGRRLLNLSQPAGGSSA